MKIFLLILGVVLILLATWFQVISRQTAPVNPPAAEEKKGEQAKASSFAECVRLGLPIAESYPRQCQSGGRMFTEDLGNAAEKKEAIQASTPRPSELVSSPLTITGMARGSWFFEAVFPVRLLDANGQELSLAQARTEEKWMTTEMVPFVATLTFEKPQTVGGTLVLEKDNPSGLPENADSLRIPVIFAQ